MLTVAKLGQETTEPIWSSSKNIESLLNDSIDEICHERGIEKSVSFSGITITVALFTLVA